MIAIKRTNILIVLFFIIGIFLNVSVAEATGSHHKYHNSTEHLVLKLAGTGFMYPMEVPGMEEGDDPMEAMCFDIDLVNVKNNKIIGTGTDCLSNVDVKENGNVSLIGTTYFHLRKGTLIARGAVTVQPVPEDFKLVGADGHQYSHITGAASDEDSIIGGTGKFANSTGRARLSGMVDMTEFTMNEGDPLAFNCLFVVDVNLN